MPTATMTSAPKKKRDFFNGSQGIDFRDFRSPTPHPHPYPHSHPHQEMHHVGMAPGDPAAYYSHTEQGYNRDLEMADSPPLAEAPGPIYASGSGAEQPTWTSNSDGDDDAKKKSKKRKPRCSMCANHGIDVELKGHKWFCPYKNQQHCQGCEIIRQRQTWAARATKQRRQQQNQQHTQMLRGAEGEAPHQGAAQSAMPALLPSSKPSDFPRMEELLKETDNILDEDLFRQIDECVRPKVTHHQ